MPESQQSIKGTQMIVDDIVNTTGRIVLDVGCGEGKWGKLLKSRSPIRVDGVEVWQPYIDKYKLARFYDNLFNIDIKEFDFTGKDYTTVILGDVFEHLTKEEALDLLSTLKTHMQTIYLTLPITICIQDGEAIGNPYESHLYQWSDKEVQLDLGFTLLNVSVNDNGLVAVGCYKWSSNV